MKKILLLASFIATFSFITRAQTQMARCTVNGTALSCSFDSAATEPRISIIVVESLLKLGVLTNDDISENAAASIGRLAENALIRLNEVTVDGRPIGSINARIIGAIAVPLVLDERSLLPLRQKAQASYANNDFKEAAKSYMPLYEINALDDMDKYHYAWSLVNTKRPVMAEKVLKSISSYEMFERQKVDVYQLLGYTYEMLDDVDQAVENYRKSLSRIVTKYEEAFLDYCNIADAYFYAKRFEQARDAYDDAATCYGRIYGVDRLYLLRDATGQLEEGEPSYRNDSSDRILFRLILTNHIIGELDEESLIEVARRMARTGNKTSAKKLSEMGITF